ncbi:MAG: ABC transporter substrate binding protein [Breznakia sp.]
MKKLQCLAMSFILVFGISACKNTKEDANAKTEVFKVGIVQIVEHPSLDTIRKATIKAIEKSDKNIDIIYKNASNDQSLLTTICQQFKDDEVDVMVAIATPSAMAAANFASDIPVIFSAVSDPVGAGLVKNLEKPEGNITGTSDEIQVAMILDLAMEMYPKTKTIGFLYNSGEANSMSHLKKVEAYAKQYKLEVIATPAVNTGEVQSATQTLIDKTDIIFAPNDNTIASTMDIVSTLTKKAKIPFFVGADSMVQDGGLASVGIDYEDLGSESGNMVLQILNGKSPRDIPVKIFKENLNVYINTAVAKAIGFDQLEDIKKQHKAVIEME